MIRFDPGTVYDVAHLRPFDLELAKAGHPLACTNGYDVRLFRETGQVGEFLWDEWSQAFKCWIGRSTDHESPFNALRLAPLAIKDGRPLHVGDEIEITDGADPDFEQALRLPANLSMVEIYRECPQFWRWPESKELPADPELGR